MTIQEIDSLSHEAKFALYLDYYLTHKAPKFIFRSAQYTWAKEEKVKPDVQKFVPNWNTYSFQEFISPERIERTDIGEVWKERGYASQIITNYYGIYRWANRNNQDV